MNLRRILSLFAITSLLLAASAAAAPTAPQPVTTATPDYPDELQGSGRDGTAMISFTVDVDGSVKDASVRSADHPAFGESALAALKQWKFKPATDDGKPVTRKVSQPFHFTAPADERINAIFGRKVFEELPEKAIAATEYRGSLAPLNQPPIRYPGSLRGSGKEETVEVAFVIGPDGYPRNPVVLGQVQPELAATAIMHVAALVFEPALKDGKPVYVETTRKIHVAETPAP